MCLSQLGNKLQHALRAYTPKDQKALKVAAQSFRPNLNLMRKLLFPNLVLVKFFVSLLDEERYPGNRTTCLRYASRSFLGVAEESKRQEIISASPYIANMLKL